MRDGVNYDSDDHKIYAPDRVDIFLFGDTEFVRLDEYKKAYEFIERIMNQRQSS